MILLKNKKNCSLFFIWPIFFFINFFIFENVYAVVELGGNYSYRKKVYGNDRENNEVERDYSFFFAKYFFTYTGIEFGYSKDEEIVTENDSYFIYSNVEVTSVQSRKEVDNYTVGIRQALAGESQMIVPVITLGYAKQFERRESDYHLLVSGQDFLYQPPIIKRRLDAVFGKFTLKIRIGKQVSFTAGIKTVFEAFQWDEAKDDIKYEAGLSILF